MQGIYVLLGLILGVLLYRLGRKEGERGKVLPLTSSRRQAPRPEQQLLRQIEDYDAGRKKENK